MVDREEEVVDYKGPSGNKWGSSWELLFSLTKNVEEFDWKTLTGNLNFLAEFLR
jgi:hypothetical protein